MVLLLLQKGADGTAELRGQTEMEMATAYGHEAVVRLLLENGANIATVRDS